jgi:hypothetical protein
MANFEKFKQQVSETAEWVAGNAVQFAKFAGEKAAYGAKLAKLNAEILGEKETMRKAYTRIGRLYVEHFTEAPHEIMLNDVEAVTLAAQRIEVLKEEIERVKAEGGVGDAEYTVYDEDDDDDSDGGSDSASAEEDDGEVGGE